MLDLSNGGTDEKKKKCSLRRNICSLRVHTSVAQMKLVDNHGLARLVVNSVERETALPPYIIIVITIRLIDSGRILTVVYFAGSHRRRENHTSRNDAAEINICQAC